MNPYNGKTIIPTETRTISHSYNSSNSENISKTTVATVSSNSATKDTVTTKANGDVDRYHDKYWNS